MLVVETATDRVPFDNEVAHLERANAEETWWGTIADIEDCAEGRGEVWREDGESTLSERGAVML